MDGNGRWAKSRGLPRTEGHRQGKENLRRILEACTEFGVEILTIYAFSTENWSRPPAEVSVLMSILNMVLDQEVKKLHKNGVRVRHIGKMDGVDPKLQKKIHDACEYTKDNTRLVLNVAFNYGGRDEIVRAVQHLIADGIKAEEVTEELSHITSTPAICRTRTSSSAPAANSA
jgi:undecaprenyl diphosphate synthase